MGKVMAHIILFMAYHFTCFHSLRFGFSQQNNSTSKKKFSFFQTVVSIFVGCVTVAFKRILRQKEIIPNKIILVAEKKN